LRHGLRHSFLFRTFAIKKKAKLLRLGKKRKSFFVLLLTFRNFAITKNNKLTYTY